MKKILVVEDEIDILETIVDTLEIDLDPDVKIQKAVNGLKALELIESDESFSLIITDLNMPKMNGKELIENIREKQFKTPVIVFTGHGDMDEFESLLSMGVNAMVKKPFIEDLVNEIKKFIN